MFVYEYLSDNWYSLFLCLWIDLDVPFLLEKGNIKGGSILISLSLNLVEFDIFKFTGITNFLHPIAIL